MNLEESDALSNKPLQRMNACAARSIVGCAATPRADARGSSRLWYDRASVRRSPLNGKTLDRRTGDAMGRKVFQDFAHVLCQKFVEVPSNRDLVNLALLGDGVLRLDITGRRATHNGFPIEPLPFTEQSLLWIESRLNELAIPRAELQGASLTIESGVKLHRKSGLPFLCVDLALTCSASVRAADREYVSTLTAEKSWGLSSV